MLLTFYYVMSFLGFKTVDMELCCYGIMHPIVDSEIFATASKAILCCMCLLLRFTAAKLC